MDIFILVFINFPKLNCSDKIVLNVCLSNVRIGSKIIFHKLGHNHNGCRIYVDIMIGKKLSSI